MPPQFQKGQVFRERLTASREVVEAFADLSEDRNPIHLEPEAARTYGYSRPLAHGAILVAAVSRIIGTKVPGPGAVWISNSTEWLAPVFVGDVVEIEVRIAAHSEAAGILDLDIEATNQSGAKVMAGKAKVKQGRKIAERSRKEMDQKVALVTGGSRGIGAAIAASLGKEGASVAVVFRSSGDRAEAVVEGIRSEGGKAAAFQADVTDGEALEKVVAEISESLGSSPDIVVHSATPPVVQKDVLELDYDEVLPFLDAYLGGGQRLARLTVPQMASRSFGRLIFMGTSYLTGNPPKGMAAYLAAKEALWGLTKSLAVEYGHAGVTSNMISPSMTVTDLTEHVPARLKEIEAAKSPAKRLATVEDTASLAAFLAGDGAGYLNGVNFPLQGGVA